MTVLVDVNLSPDWATFLNKSGIHAAHWSSLGPTDTPDREILAYAKRGQYVILTRDLDFGTILSTGKLFRPSVLQLRVRQAGPDQIGQLVVQVLNQAAAELARGAIVTIDLKRTRISLLPLTPRDLTE